MEKEKHLGLRIDAETHKKLKSLAEFEGRSINGEVLYLIRQASCQMDKARNGICKKSRSETPLCEKKQYLRNLF